ncbi:hypothetical protein [Nocardia sp. NPDC052566]|uniref:hypothetical protein n=1 Tax=Nocardia sp. NPDC052566 TaxID=3364330 RepID=UPI0037CC1CDC
MSTGLLILVIVGVIALVIKRFRGEPMNARDTFGTPLILVAVGVYSVTKVADLNGTDITWLVVGGVVGIVFGAIRGTTIGIFERDGHLWQRYTSGTVVVWLVSMGVGFGVNALGAAMGMHHDARPTTLSIGIGMLGEMLTLGLRALSTGVPFAPDRTGPGSPLDRLLGDSGSTANESRRDAGHSEHGSAQPFGTSPQAGRDAPVINDGPHRSPTVRDGLNWLNTAKDRLR